MIALIVIAAFIVAFVGFLMTPSTTAGLYLIGLACFLAILARMVQSERQHREAHPRPLTPAATAGPRDAESFQ